MIKRQRAILSAAACLCLLLGIGIGLNGCGQKGDLSEKEENSVESQMGEVQQGVEQNTDNAKQFHGNSGNSETGEWARTSEQVHALDQNLQNGGQGRNGQDVYKRQGPGLFSSYRKLCFHTITVKISGGSYHGLKQENR